MNIGSFLLKPWNRVFDWSGRSRRSEMLTFYVEFFGGIFLGVILGGGSFSSDHVTDTMAPWATIAVGIYGLCGTLPALGVQIRRLHDQNRSGWWLLMGAIPLLGHLMWLAFMFWPGTEGDNRFGKNPRTEDAKNPSPVES